MYGEHIHIIKVLSNIGESTSTGLSNTLSAFGGAIIGGGLSFLGSRLIFNKQRKHDLRKEKIVRSGELMTLILTTDLSMRENSYEHDDETSYKNPFSNMSNKKLLIQLIDNLNKIKINYKIITGKKLDFFKDVEIINDYFIRKVIKRSPESEEQLCSIAHNIETKIHKAYTEVNEYLNANNLGE